MYIVGRASEKEAITFSVEVVGQPQALKIIKDLLARGYRYDIPGGKMVLRVNPSEGLVYSIWSLWPEEHKELLRAAKRLSKNVA
jgi:hypothetical protein